MHVQFTGTEAAEQARDMVPPTLDELARQGARQMIGLGLQLEVAAAIGNHAALRTVPPDGKLLSVPSIRLCVCLLCRQAECWMLRSARDRYGQNN